MSYTSLKYSTIHPYVLYIPYQSHTIYVYIHPHIGKDRTGIISLFVLYLRGVSVESILDDYHLSRYAYNHCV